VIIINSVGINIEAMNQLKKKFLDYEEYANDIFNRLDIEFDELLSDLSGDAKNTLQGRITKIRMQYKTIKENIESYSKDFDNVINQYQNQDYELSTKITGDINKIN